MNLKNKKILVTGADGFIGSHLTEELLGKGARVKALSYYNSFNNWGWLEDIPENENMEIITGDIRDSHFCMKLASDADVIFHLAALIAIPYSYQAPESYIDTNIKGTLNICEAARQNGNTRLIHTSTSEVYGTAKYVPIDENHPKQPQSPYSATKIGADAIAMSYFNSFGLPVTTARPFNTYGPRQSARAIIPTIITQIASGMKEIRLGDLTPKRDFNFVKDTCRGFIAIAESDSTIGEEINICSGSEVSMFEVLNLIKETMNSDVNFVSEEGRVRPENSEVFRLLGDNSLLLKTTGYKHGYNLKEGIGITCQWFSRSENLRKYKSGIYNI